MQMLQILWKTIFKFSYTDTCYQHMKNWCFPTMVLEKSLESPLESKEIKPVNLKQNQPWILIEKTDADVEAEASVFWSPDVNSWLNGKDPDAGKDWRQEERVTDSEMIGCCNRFINVHKIGQIPGDGIEQGLLVCSSPWVCRVSETTWWLNNKNKKADFRS